MPKVHCTLQFSRVQNRDILMLNPCCLFYTTLCPTRGSLLPNRTCVPPYIYIYIQKEDMIGSTCFRIALGIPSLHLSVFFG